jgi:hypothetical protein
MFQLNMECRGLMIKINPRIFVGCGNQLFCYAAASRMGQVLDDFSGYAYDTFYHNHYELDYFNIPCRKAKTAERLELFC